MIIFRGMNLSLIRLVMAFLLIFPVACAATMVRMHTSLGVIDIKLDDSAPLTVANFLSYVDSGAYSHSFIHRSVPGFIIQGGGYVWNGTSNPVNSIATITPVVNEFSSNRSNLRGTIAMAKLGGNPDSATSQWFFNLADNSANLDGQNGGFTVFGKVVDKSMSIVDAIAALPIRNVGGAFSKLPITSNHPTGTETDLVVITAISSNRSSINANDSDRLFAYLETLFPEYLSPASPLDAVSTTMNGYYYRYYPATNSYIATTSNGDVYYLGPVSGNQVIKLDSNTMFVLGLTATSLGY